MILLQTAAPAANAAAKATAEAANAAGPSISLWQLCLDGGWIMIVLAVLLAICIYVFIERAIAIGKADHTDDGTNVRYKTSAPYGRIGIDFNLLKNKHDSPFYYMVQQTRT